MRKIFLSFICILSILLCIFGGCSNGAMPSTHDFQTEEELKSFMIEKVEFDKEKEYYLFDLSCLSNLTVSEDQSFVLSVTHKGRFPETCDDVFEGLWVEKGFYKYENVYCTIAVEAYYADDFKLETENRTEVNESLGGTCTETTEIQPVVIDGMQGNLRNYTKVTDYRDHYGVSVGYCFRVYQEDIGIVFFFRYDQSYSISYEDFELSGKYEFKNGELITYEEVYTFAAQAIQSRYVIAFEDDVTEEEIIEEEV